jgi:large subunit ribosomal protein L18
MVSSRHMYVQFVDDERGATLAAVSTLGGSTKNNVAAARALGKQAAELALKKGIARAVVDRGGFKFHGRVKAIVDAAVAGGIAVRTSKSGIAVETNKEK